MDIKQQWGINNFLLLSDIKCELLCDIMTIMNNA